jgi:Rieske Fe-S protein
MDAFVKPITERSRRDLLRSVGVIALAGGSAAMLGACSGGDSGEAGGGSGSGASAASGPLTVAKSEVPEGSGVIDGAFVVTQPAAGDYKAFSSACTHQGCPVSSISDGKIMCNCHGSEFSISDGSVLNGPAETPLTAASVTADGDSLTVTA